MTWREVCYRFLAGGYGRCHSTATDGVSLWLHGFEIARHTPAGVIVNHCGWHTQSTTRRLNAIGFSVNIARGIIRSDTYGVWSVSCWRGSGGRPIEDDDGNVRSDLRACPARITREATPDEIVAINARMCFSRRQPPAVVVPAIDRRYGVSCCLSRRKVAALPLP